MLANITSVTNLAESGPLTWDMAKQIIQSQSNLAIIGIAVLVAVAVGLMGASWIWNLFLRRHELEKATESLKSEILTKGKEDFAKLTTETKDVINNMKKEIEKSVSKKMDLFNAEKASLFALVIMQYKWWESAAVSWAIAIRDYVKIGEEGMIRPQ